MQLRLSAGAALFLRCSGRDPVDAEASMGDLYGVLALPRNASDDDIKVAYRVLARRLHPDVNVSDEASAQRLQEVNRAYQTLGNPEARAAYDRDLAGQRASARRRYAILGASTLATFALTMTAVSFAVRWHLEAAAPAHKMRLRPGPVGETAPEPPKGEGEHSWTTYRDSSGGFALRYPAAVFALDSAQSTRAVQTFVSRDGRAVLRILADKLPRGTTLRAFRRALLRKRYAGASFESTPLRAHWFALSGTRGENAFFERVTFSCDRRSMHGWQMVYPKSARATYDELARQVLRNEPHGNGPDPACKTAKPKQQARRRRE
jgi:curved DNA-binding protein CbpA